MQQPKAESTNFSSKFQETVFQLVEKIEEEIWYYDVDGTIKSEYGVKYIEMKNQAARVQNVLKLCIQQIELIFCLPQLISNESKQLTELCTNEEIEEIGKFFRKYSKQGNGTSDDFDGELHKYLDTAHRNKIFELIKRYSKDVGFFTFENVEKMINSFNFNLDFPVRQKYNFTSKRTASNW